jgi:hypothetical protein
LGLLGPAGHFQQRQNARRMILWLLRLVPACRCRACARVYACLCHLVRPTKIRPRSASASATICHRRGKPRYYKIGRYPDECPDIDKVRDEAAQIHINAKNGIDPKRPILSNAFAKVVEDFIDRHAKKNRSWKETQRLFNTYVLPQWRDLNITDIRRSTVTDLLDKIEAKALKHPTTGELVGGTVTAAAVLAALSKLFNWHALRVDDFSSALVKGMHRAKPPKERARQRVLTSDELRLLWPILSDMGVYGAAVQCMLLTAQRARRVGAMRRSEIINGVKLQKDGHTVMVMDHVWDSGGGEFDPKNKGTSPVPLSRLAREIIDAVPIVDAEQRHAADYVFSVNGREAFNGWSKAKERLDRKLLAALRAEAKQAGLEPDKVELKPWQLRDLRRTARTLMSRAGVTTEIAERCLGHVMTLVRGTYDRYDYLAEKQDAFERLADLIERTVQPREDNIIPLRR